MCEGYMNMQYISCTAQCDSEDHWVPTNQTKFPSNKDKLVFNVYIYI